MIRTALLLAGLLALSGMLQGKPSFTLLFTGDTGGRLKPGRGNLGGIARRVRMVEKIRRENKNILLVDVGDFLSPDYLSIKSSGLLATRLMRKMKYDIVTLGNHDFDYGTKILEDRITFLGGSGTDFTSCNITAADGSRYIYPYIIRTVGCTKKKVCFIGVTDPRARIPAARDRIKIDEPAGRITAVMESLKGEHIDYMVCLAHMRRDRILRLAEQVPFIDLFICLGEGEEAHNIKTVEFTDVTGGHRRTIVNASRSGMYLGRADIALDGSKNISVSSIPLDAGIGEDPEIAQQVFIEDNMANYPLFSLDKTHNNADSLARIFLRILKDRTRSEVAVLNYGMFHRWSMPVADGQVRFNDIYEFIWVSDAMVRVKLPGRRIKEIVKQGLRSKWSARLYVDGIDLKKNLINGKMIYDNDLYTVVTNDFLAGGGDGYTAFARYGKHRQELFCEKGGYLAGSNQGREYELRNDVLVPELIRHRSLSEMVLTDPAARPLWKFSLAGLGGAVNQSWWNDKTPAYGSGPNFPYQGLLHIDAAARLTVTRLDRMGRWKNELSAGFGKQQYEGVDLYETPNDLVAVSRYEFQKILKRPKMFQTFYPFVQLKMDSEVTEGADEKRQLDGFADLGLGLSLYDLKDLRVSVGAVRDLSIDSSKTAVSFGVHGRFQRTFKRPFKFALTDRLVYEAKLGADDNDDHRLYLYTSFDIPLVTDLSVRSQVNWYNYWNRTVDEWGMAADYKVSLNYTFNMKMQVF